MWITEDVDLPERLILAQRENRLVVFAGAGVSMGEPSNLPDFDLLAQRVGAVAADRREGEQVDHYLGRVESLGPKVQDLVRGIISAPDSHPRQIHRDIIDLFGAANSVRLVTTNFDSHFSTVAAERFQEGVETYFAPALPLGHDFAGIAYIHGSVLRRKPQLVLTDRDFGRAYLTEGWATRFLMDLFGHFTVLFVGYSHDDPVMRYLARSLTGASERFVLTPPHQDEKWASLGITSVEFPKREGNSPFGALDATLRAWVSRSKMGALDHEQRIGEILSGSPILEPEAADYMRAALRDEVTLRFFTQHARTVDWLHWAEEDGALTPLLAANGQRDERTQILAHWFATTYAVAHAGSALDLLGRNGGTLAPVLWHEVARHLAVCDQPPSAAVLTKWIVVLLICAPEHHAADQLGQLLLRCKTNEHLAAAKLLFSYLVRPRFRIDRPWTAQVEGEERARIRMAIRLRGERHSLASAWTAFFVPRQAQLRYYLKDELSQSIALAHRFSMAETDGGFDPISFGRSAIEVHEQDRFNNDIDFAIDGLRSVLENTIAEDHAVAAQWIAEWVRADSSVLKRIALHGIAEDATHSPDDALALILALRMTFAPHVKHEVFRVLEKKFANASDGAQHDFIEGVKATEIKEREIDENVREIGRYERYNLAVWLAKHAPASRSAAAFLQLTQRGDPEFKERDHPDFDHWSGGASWVVERSPRSAEELLRVRPAEQLTYLLQFERPSGEWEGPSRAGLMTGVQEAASADFEWSFELAIAVAGAGEWRSTLWRALFGAWWQADLSQDSLRRVASALRQWPQLIDVFARDLSDFIEKTASKASNIDGGVLGDLEVLAVQCLEVEDAVDGIITTPERREWLTVAMNHSGGRAAMAMLKILPIRIALIGEDRPGIPEPYRSAFERVFVSPTIAASRARIILASQTHYFFAIDPQWTRGHLLPLFDWERNERDAEQAWHGYMGWGRWHDALLAEFTPLLRATFERLTTNLKEIADSFASRFAGIALYSSVDPWHGGWLPTFVRVAGAEACSKWALHMAQSLRELEPDAIMAAWEHWLRDYWNDRLSGLPRPFTDGERAEMLQWILALEPVFHEATQMLVAEHVILDEHSMLFYELQDHIALVSFPEDVATLTAHVLSSNQIPLYDCGHLTSLVARLRANGVAREKLLPIVTSMIQMGCGTAGSLLKLIE